MFYIYIYILSARSYWTLTYDVSLCAGVNFTRFITREELRKAMTQYGMGDEATIDEVIEDVDTNKVIILTWILIPNFFPSFP